MACIIGIQFNHPRPGDTRNFFQKPDEILAIASAKPAIAPIQVELPTGRAMADLPVSLRDGNSPAQAADHAHAGDPFFRLAMEPS